MFIIRVLKSGNFILYLFHTLKKDPTSIIQKKIVLPDFATKFFTIQ